MALADRTKEAAPRPIHGKPCSVGALLQQLKSGERKALESMMGNPEWTAPAIWEALRDEGYEVGRQTIGRHRHGKCRCFL